VLNKLDDFKKNEDNIPATINKARKYLEDKGIINPNIYPAAALPALNIRRMEHDLIDIDLADETELKIKKLNRNEEMHLEQYAPLPPSVKGEIENSLAAARQNNNVKAEALIHTGIVPLEFAIRMYVQKYAKTAKIKNIVDTFIKKLESAQSFETTKKEIATNVEKQKEIRCQLELIEKKIQDGKGSKIFQEKLDAIDITTKIETISRAVIQSNIENIVEYSKSQSGRITTSEAENYV